MRVETATLVRPEHHRTDMTEIEWNLVVNLRQSLAIYNLQWRKLFWWGSKERFLQWRWYWWWSALKSVVFLFSELKKNIGKSCSDLTCRSCPPFWQAEWANRKQIDRNQIHKEIFRSRHKECQFLAATSCLEISYISGHRANLSPS